MKFDYHPFIRRGLWPILVISVMHVYQALLLHVSPDALGATDLTALAMAFRLIHLPNDTQYLQLIMCVSSALALFGVFFRVGWWRLAVFVPQHLIIGAMAWGGLLATFLSQYLDGTPMGWAHISADQIGYLALFMIHSFAIWGRCQDPESNG